MIQSTPCAPLHLSTMQGIQCSPTQKPFGNILEIFISVVMQQRVQQTLTNTLKETELHISFRAVAVKLPEPIKDRLSLMAMDLQGQNPCTPMICRLRVLHGNLSSSGSLSYAHNLPRTPRSLSDRATLIHRKGQRTLARHD